MADHNATEAKSRRNVLKTAGGLLAGSTMLAGLGAGPAAAETEEGLRFKIEETNKEYIAVRVSMSGELYERVNERGALAERAFLGPAARFIIEGDTVRLPENPEAGLASPVKVAEFEKADISGGGKVYTNDMLYSTREIDSSEVEDEEVTLGLGVFPEQTVPRDYWGTNTIPEIPIDA